MATSFRTRFRRGRGGRLSRWLGRIDGVEKPALLVGLGMVLFRVWKSGDPTLSRRDRWRQIMHRWRQRWDASVARVVGGQRPGGGEDLAQEEIPDRAPGAAEGSDREQQSGLRHPPP
jgi:hypothetical protein